MSDIATAQAKLDELRAKAKAALCVLMRYPPNTTSGLIDDVVDPIIEAGALQAAIWQKEALEDFTPSPHQMGSPA